MMTTTTVPDDERAAKLPPGKAAEMALQIVRLNAQVTALSAALDHTTTALADFHTAVYDWAVQNADHEDPASGELMDIMIKYKPEPS